MDYNLIIGIIAFLVSYYVIKYLLFKKIEKNLKYEQEIAKILNNEDCKVKGRFE